MRWKFSGVNWALLLARFLRLHRSGPGDYTKDRKVTPSEWMGGTGRVDLRGGEPAGRNATDALAGNLRPQWRTRTQGWIDQKNDLIRIMLVWSERAGPLSPLKVSALGSKSVRGLQGTEEQGINSEIAPFLGCRKKWYDPRVFSGRVEGAGRYRRCAGA